MTQYLSCAETAKLVRSALKESFPGQKFSVRSSVYSGGASIRVQWVDGPNSEQVKSVTRPFEGSYFDGMTDYKGAKYNSFDGEEISFGADFIFTDRDYSDELVDKAISAVFVKYQKNFEIKNISLPNIKDYRSGKYYNVQLCGGVYMETSLRAMISEEASNISSFQEVIKSPTLEKVESLGDDGYGYGRTGRVA